MGRRATNASPININSVTALERNRLPLVGRLGRVWGVRDSKWHRIDSQEVRQQEMGLCINQDSKGLATALLSYRTSFKKHKI